MKVVNDEFTYKSIIKHLMFWVHLGKIYKSGRMQLESNKYKITF